MQFLKIKTTFFATIGFLLLVGCKNNTKTSDSILTDSEPSVPFITYAITKQFPHDTSLFTEGLLIHDGQLYESTGSPPELPQTKSLIVVDDLNTGKSSKKVELDGKYFGEGIVFLKDKLYQLTYKNKVGFIYNSNDFIQVGTFSYSNNEAWSLTTDGSSLIMSDGTDKLTFLNPNGFKPTKIISVTENKVPVVHLNELEFIKGFIYANIWQTNYIVKIDPSNGNVVGKLDLNSLSLDAKHKNLNADVLNGIAYDSTNDNIYVTGKLWPGIYQINFIH